MDKVQTAKKLKIKCNSFLVLGIINIIITFFVSTFILFAIPLIIIGIIYYKKYNKIFKTLSDEEKQLLEKNISNKEESKKKQTKIEKKQTKFEKQLTEMPLVENIIDKSAEKTDKQYVPGFRFKAIRKDTDFDDIFPLVVIDVETTGLNCEENEIIEVSAIKFVYGFKPSEAFTTLINPDEKIPKRITDINNITNEMVAQSPKIYQVMGALNEFVSDCNIAGHNIGFDLKFLYTNGFKNSKSSYIFDTLSIARTVVPKDEIENYKLITLCDYYGITPSNLHRSLSDCLATSKVFKGLLYDKTEKLCYI